MRLRKKELGNLNIIGANITKLRKLHKMSQKELAINMQFLGVDINFTSLSKLEGQTRFATDKEVWAVAQVFGIKTDDLFKNI